MQNHNNNNFKDPLAEGVKKLGKEARHGFVATLWHLFSFTSVKFLLVFIVMGGFSVAFFSFGVRGDTTINVTLKNRTGGGAIDLERDLVGHWTFDGNKMLSNVTDSSGQGNTGYLTGFTSTTTVPGAIGQALVFDGTDDYSNSNSVATDADANNDNQISIFAWIKVTSDICDGTPECTVIGVNTSGYGDVFSLSLGGSGTDELNIRDGGVSEGDTNIDVATGEWKQIGYVRRGTTGYLYVDGVQQAIHTANFSLAGTDFWSVGQEWDAGPVVSDLLLGAVDDVRIYNRMLSSEEIRNLYAMGATTHINTSFSSGSLDENLVGHWTFDGNKMLSNVTDSSGQGNTGYLTGFTSTTTVPGAIGQALSFDGSNDLVAMGQVATLDFNDTDDFTISAWFRRDSVDDGAQHVVASRRNGFLATAPGYSLTIDSTVSVNKLVLEVSDAVDEYSVTSTQTFSVGNWNHVVVIWDQDNAANTEFYINGVDDNATDSGTIGDIGSLTSTREFRLGNTVSNANPFFGDMDDVRVYRRALTPEQAKRLYDLGATTHINTSFSSGSLQTGLVGYWTFDGKDMYTRAADVSGSGNNGNLINFTSTTTVIGKIGQALDFDGTSNYIRAADSASLDLSSSFTISAWVYYRGTGGTVGNYIVSKYITIVEGNQRGYTLFLESTATNCAQNNGICGFLSTDGISGNLISGASLGAVPLNRWSHIVMEYDGTNAYYYLNGVKSSNTALSGSLFNNSQALTVGSRQDSTNTGYFGGSIDDVRIYNRALFPTEIQRLYDMGR